MPAQKAGGLYKPVALFCRGLSVPCSSGRRGYFQLQIKLQIGLLLVGSRFKKKEAKCSSVQFPSQFVQPHIQRGALFIAQPVKYHAHAEAGMGVDHRAGKLAGAAAVADAKANVSPFGQRVDGIDVAAAGPQFRDARSILHSHDFRFGNKCKARSRSSHGVGSVTYGLSSSDENLAQDASSHCTQCRTLARSRARTIAKELAVL